MLDVRGLNPPQREAVLHGDGPLLVLAGAGSGKTRVITYRVARLLERGVPAGALCALTFTNKAADEMRERLRALAGRDAEGVTMCTFHALGLAILKAERKGRFAIYDAADQLGVIREALREIRVDDRRFDARAIQQRISRAKNAFAEPAAEGDEYDQITALVWPRYQRALQAFAAYDFDDLIVEPVRLFERDPAARARWERRFWYLLVDEYQDTNRAQLIMLRALSGHGNVTVVGDDDQSIYAWRGAEASNILEFERHFPGARVVKLEQNYRSTPTILAAANAVIRHNPARHDKTLFSDRPGGDRIVLAVCADADAEAKLVCDEIERLRQDERRRYADFAVLYRSNAQARPLEEALRGRRIPYDLRGGQEFYERKEVKDVIAYLKLALHPSDEIALRRIVNYPARGIGVASLERAAQWGADKGVTLLTALARWGEYGAEKQRAPVAGFVALVERLRAGLRAGGAAAARAARALVEDISLYDDLRAAAPSLTAAQRRVDNVEDFLRSLERLPPDTDLADYLHRLTLDSKDEDEGRGGDEVTLSTLHGAKGLEWPVVFVVGLEEELLPHARTEGEDVSEERRLAYVGITRARERLYLTRARVRRKHGGDRARVPSRFLGEIPPELLEVRDLDAEAAAPVDKAALRSFFQGFLR